MHTIETMATAAATGIIAIENPDKEFHESWDSKLVKDKLLRRHPMNIPHPFRAVLLGPPGSGKTTIAINLIMYQKPDFQRVIVIHIDGEYTHEYDAVGNYEVMDKIPPPTWWTGDEKTLVILDDLEFKQLGKRQFRNLDRLFGYVSTHKNISVVLTAQDPFNVPPIVRRCANLWVLWRTRDIDSLGRIARRAGLTKEKMMHLFETFQEKDSLWIDYTIGTPYPLRKNGISLLHK